MSKKLKKTDIQKNASLQVSHSINKIKQNERRYTIILVMIFMILFGIIGYTTLAINNNNYEKYASSITYGVSDLESSSDVVVLDKKDILENEIGLKKDSYNINIINNSDSNKKYNIKFIIDKDKMIKCGCDNKEVDSLFIHYSLDGINILNFLDNNMIIYQGEIAKKDKDNIKIKMWLDKQLDIYNNYQVHGHFIVEDID